MTIATDAQLPRRLPVLPGVALAARYLLADGEPVGRGDALDAFVLPGQRLALAVVDVVGQGVEATVAVAEMVAILRDRLHGGSDLRTALCSLDRYAEHYERTNAATAAVIVLDLGSGDYEYATTGHPPPLQAGPEGGTRLLVPSAAARPLGTGGELTTRRGHLPMGGTLMLFTDGLLTGAPGGVGAAAAVVTSTVRGIVTEAAGGRVPAADLVERVLDDLLPAVLPADGIPDDVAVLAAVRRARPHDFSFDTQATDTCLPHLRDALGRWLTVLGAGLLDHISIAHAVSELATNSAEHAYTGAARGDEQPLQVRARLRDTGRVEVVVSDRGRWRGEVKYGRGLAIASGLSDNLVLHRSVSGTTVQFSQRLGRPVTLLDAVTEGRSDRHLTWQTATLELHRGPGVLTVRGAVVDEQSVDLFDATLEEATSAGAADTQLDLSEVSFFASSAVHSVFLSMRRCQRHGARLAVHAPRGTPAGELLRVAGFPGLEHPPSAE